MQERLRAIPCPQDRSGFSPAVLQITKISFILVLSFLSFLCNTEAMNSLALSEAPILPPRDRKPITDLGQFMRASSKHLQIRSDDGRAIELPTEVYDVLLNVVSAMQEGKAITVAPLNLQLTTQEAADFLGISRPSVVKLLEEQEIPYEQPGKGRHRKVRLSDLMDYQKRIRVERGSRLGTLIRRAAEDGFYTEDVPDNFLEVIAEVRGSRNK